MCDIFITQEVINISHFGGIIMNSKMNIKLKLAMEAVTVLYVLLCAVLSKEKLIGSGFFNILTLIWIAMWVIISFYKKSLNGITDELVISILGKVNKICLYFLVLSFSLFSILLISPYSQGLTISRSAIGISLMTILLIYTVIRLLLFMYYERKGLN